VTRLTGRGGWPLTVFCTPDGRPFYGGTYFPPEPRHGLPSFRQVLLAVAEAYRERKGEVEQSAGRILAALAEPPAGRAQSAPGAHTAVQAALRLLQGADQEHGGFGGAPKFPTPCYLELLLAAQPVLPERKAREAQEHVVLSCREMSRGGVYDQLGGGFHRYSVDERWAVPHFEKMLYDQGQLLRVYVEAWRRGGAADDDLLWPVRETAAYLRREMRSAEGGFYASQDADSEGEEGVYYVWTPPQIEAALGSEAGAAFCRAYGVTARGNFEHGTTVLADAAREPRDRFAVDRARLLAVRAGRVAPATDRKRVAAWNALAISGLARAASLLADDAMLADAVTAAGFVETRMRDGAGRLARVWNEGRASVPAFLDDLAAWLEATLDLHRAGAGDRWLGVALAAAEDIARRFYDADAADLFLTPADGEPLVHRPRSDHDGATPHSTGLAVLGLLRLAELADRADLRGVAERVIETHAFELERAPQAFPTLARAALVQERGASVAVIVGAPDDAATRALAARARRVLEPNDAVVVHAPGAPAPAGLAPSWLSGREPRAGRPTVWICRGVTCSPAENDPEALAALAQTPAALR
jgi:uncharacterized protein YyaL (SSP411 family)